MAKRIYWETSPFIAFLSGTHPDEIARSIVCEDVLKSARDGDIEIWTSTWTIVETIRPKASYQPTPHPLWAELLNAKDQKGNIVHPNAASEFDVIWKYYKRNTLPTRPLSDADATRIKHMFDWPWINKIQVIPAISHRAAEIARSHNMKPGDALHVASALHAKCDCLHRWDRDYSRTDTLIRSCEPERISSQNLLPGIGP
jgi:predicted nucleic acid-binding protein